MVQLRFVPAFLPMIICYFQGTPRKCQRRIVSIIMERGGVVKGILTGLWGTGLGESLMVSLSNHGIASLPDGIGMDSQ